MSNFEEIINASGEVIDRIAIDSPLRAGQEPRLNRHLSDPGGRARDRRAIGVAEEAENYRDMLAMHGITYSNDSDIPSTKVVKCSVACRFVNDGKCIRSGAVSITDSGRCMNYSPANHPDPAKEFISPIDSVEI